MHPLTTFQYCPKCGSSHFLANNFKSKKCENCGFIYYFNSSASTAAFITCGDRLLVVRRAKEPAKGSWDLPGGFIDLYETAEEAVRREIEEETGLQVNNLHYLFSLPNIYPYSGMDIHTVDLFYHCTVNDISAIRPADDVDDLSFLETKDILPEKFGLQSIRKAIEIWLKRSPSA
jgi:NADH pyrophosphatase NudC (nudix superfamily)